MHHAILGAGGVGGLIGAALAKSGERVTLILRPESLKNYPAELSLESPLESFRVPVERAAAVTQPVDVLWITVKATQIGAALSSVIVDPQQIGAIVPLLNGIDHIELLRTRFGHDRVVPASIAVEAERVSPGIIVQRGTAIRLNISSIGESRLATAVEELTASGFKCQFSADEMKILWTKLAFLAPYALTTTASGLSAGEINGQPSWRQKFVACVREACAVSTASGIPLDAAPFIRFFDSMPSGAQSSMQKDVAAGNQPELDAIAGPILRGAEQRHLEVPVTQELADLVKRRSLAMNKG